MIVVYDVSAVDSIDVCKTWLKLLKPVGTCQMGLLFARNIHENASEPDQEKIARLELLFSRSNTISGVISAKDPTSIAEAFKLLIEGTLLRHCLSSPNNTFFIRLRNQPKEGVMLFFKEKQWRFNM